MKTPSALIRAALIESQRLNNAAPDNVSSYRHHSEAIEALASGRLFISGCMSAPVLLVGLNSLPEERLSRFLLAFAEGRKAHANAAVRELAGCSASITKSPKGCFVIDFSVAATAANGLRVVAGARGMQTIPTVNVVNGGPHWLVIVNRKFADEISSATNPKLRAWAISETN